VVAAEQPVRPGLRERQRLEQARLDVAGVLRAAFARRGVGRLRFVLECHRATDGDPDRRRREAEVREHDFAAGAVRGQDREQSSEPRDREDRRYGVPAPLHVAGMIGVPAPMVEVRAAIDG